MTVFFSLTRTIPWNNPMDPITILLVGGGIWAYREFNKRDYGVLTPERDERYRNAMEYIHDPQQLMAEAKLYAEHGLKTQAKLLKRRAEWRSRSEALKQEHEAIYQKALASKNIPAILQVANAFNGWTATKKAQTLLDRVRELQETSVLEATQAAATSAEVEEKPQRQTQTRSKKGNGAAHTEPFTGVTDTPLASGNEP
jgi:arginine utilization protein RocB